MHALAAMVCAAALAAPEADAVFEPFDARLAPGWTWLREVPGQWRLADGGLEIRIPPGRAPDVTNALLRRLPDRRGKILTAEVTVRFVTPPTEQYEQAGLTWYRHDKPSFKLVHERIDGAMYVIPGRVPSGGGPLVLRLVVEGERFTAQFRPIDEKEFRKAAEGKFAAPEPSEQISVQCYHGPPKAEHWVRFDDFRLGVR